MEPNEHRLFNFLEKYSFLYDTPNSDFFSGKLYSRADISWLEFLSNLNYAELNVVVTDFQLFQDCPSSLKVFFMEALSVSCLGEPKQSDKNLSLQPAIKQVKAKKLHELYNFYEVLEIQCKKYNINRVVDIGCGLGHLLNYFSTRCQRSKCFELVGIEADNLLCCAANIKYENAKFVNLKFLSGNLACRNVLADKTDSRSAIISLHGCGDLQSMILKEFVELQHNQDVRNGKVPLLMTIGCCYHKIKNFDDWPLSKRLKNCIKTKKLPVSAFRLACQERISRWKHFSDSEHENHKREFVNRALVQCIYNNLDVKITQSYKRHNRKLGSTVDELAERLMERNGILSAEERIKWKTSVEKVEKEYKHLFDYTEAFTALQFAMQGPLETLVLWDRVWFLRENNLEATMLPVFNSQISPRNMCILASFPS